VKGQLDPPWVRLLDFQGREVGVVAIEEARRLTEERRLELIVVNAQADPPVYRMVDFSRFKFESAKRLKEARRLHGSQAALKELWISAGIAPHDLGLKVEHLRRLLGDGHRCRVIVVFADPQVQREAGMALLERVARALVEVGVVEKIGEVEGATAALTLCPQPFR
jgi:translation initiation factor IF-3